VLKIQQLSLTVLSYYIYVVDHCMQFFIPLSSAIDNVSFIPDGNMTVTQCQLESILLLLMCKNSHVSGMLINIVSSNQWRKRNQGGDKWAIAHFIWRFAHSNFLL